MTRDAPRVALALAAACAAVLAAGLAAGADGWSAPWPDDAGLVAGIRAPRTLGALLAGACLGLAGAIAQGLFRNPLADPWLLGTASGAALGVTAALALAGGGLALGAASAGAGLGLAGAAFAGALAGVAATLALAGGASRPVVLLLAGVVVGVTLGALSDLLLLRAPDALRGRQAFMLGTTGFVGWSGVALLAGALGVCLPTALRLARALDALVLGEAGAASLGLELPRLRLALVAAMALATGTAVSQCGMVGFVGLAAPHLVRRLATLRHGPALALSALAGAALLGAADVAARVLAAPQELPVGVLTALLGGPYLLVLLRRGVRA